MEKNAIVEVYKGVNVRKTNRVVLKLGVAAFKTIIDEVDKTSLSVQKILAYSSMPCEKCKNECFVFFDKNDNEIKVKRGILSKHIPEGNGINIIENAKNNSCKKP